MQDTSNEVAFVGIGKMGLPISVLIAKAGYSVTAYDQSAERLAHKASRPRALRPRRSTVDP
jgi:3-hydroxyisobutyrate dehydrogenase-like beta-hydroxyacid dehydrogenase